MSELIEKLPGLDARWKEHLDYWEGEEPGIFNDMVELADYFLDNLSKSNEEVVVATLNWAERNLTLGNETEKDAICTGFFESVLNALDEDSKGLAMFQRHIGEQSKAFCTQWLSFSGGSLPGF